jgi:hypothetical protein
MGMRKEPKTKMRVESTCAVCGTTYLVPPWRAAKTRYCSTFCMGRDRGRSEVKKRANRLRTDDPDTKMCSRCGQVKSISEFGRRPGNRDGLRGNCKSCAHERTAAWLARDDNKQRKIKMDRAYYAREADRVKREAREKYAADSSLIRARNKGYRDKDVEKYRAISRRRRLLKPDIVRAARRQHYRDNKPIYVANAAKRQERVRRATPPWADLKLIETFYVEADRMTRETGVKHHVDHYYPLISHVMCGLHVPANLRVVPALVNLQKSNSIPEQEKEDA